MTIRVIGPQRFFTGQFDFEVAVLYDEPWHLSAMYYSVRKEVRIRFNLARIQGLGQAALKFRLGTSLSDQKLFV